MWHPGAAAKATQPSLARCTDRITADPPGARGHREVGKMNYATSEGRRVQSVLISVAIVGWLAFILLRRDPTR
jgi:hypothetical protein